MDFRKINSYAILLAIVVVVGLLVSMIARFVILAKGADTGTANLVFIIVMGVCAIFYLTVMAAFSSVAAKGRTATRAGLDRTDNGVAGPAYLPAGSRRSSGCAAQRSRRTARRWRSGRPPPARSIRRLS